MTMSTCYHIIYDREENVTEVEQGPELFPEGKQKKKKGMFLGLEKF